MEDEAELSGDFRATDPLGPTLLSFPPPGNLRSAIVVVLVTALVVVIGSYFAIGSWWMVVHGHSESIPGCIFGFAFIGLGLLLIASTLRLWTLHVHLCKLGFSYNQWRTRRIFPWKCIREVREAIIRDYRSYADKRAGCQSVTRIRFLVTDSDGRKFRFGDNDEPWAKPLELALRQAAVEYGFSWDVYEDHRVDINPLDL